jgi:predicted dienelactone hydrolase
MKRRLDLIAALTISLVVVTLAVAEPVSHNMAARTELHAIESMTLSDAQFLTGDAKGTPTATTGELRVAAGSGRLPLVMLQHGSGGMGANIEMWAREFNAMGVSTFALDGLTGRGLINVNTDQALLGRLNFILDIYRALDVLAKHLRVESHVARISHPSNQATSFMSLRLYKTAHLELGARCSDRHG